MWREASSAEQDWLPLLQKEEERDLLLPCNEAVVQLLEIEKLL